MVQTLICTIVPRTGYSTFALILLYKYNSENVYIYIYEMGSSYTRCNLTRVTPFIDHKFVIDLMVKKIALNAN